MNEGSPVATRQVVGFGAFFNLAFDLLCVTDRSGRFVAANEAWGRTLSVPTAELLGRRYADYVHPDDREVT